MAEAISAARDVDPEQRRRYFTRLSGQVRDVMRLHREVGNFEPRNAPVQVPEGKQANWERDWGNVTEHCLVQVARTGVMADLLQLLPDVKADLQIAAALHDVDKKNEIMALKRAATWESYHDAGVQGKAQMEAAGFTERQVWLATSVGHETIPEAEELAKKPNLTDAEKAWLIMHYADDYTIDANWVQPAEWVPSANPDENGQLVNDLERRMQRNIAFAQPGQKYEGIQNAGLEHFGEPTYDAQLRVGLMVQERVADLVVKSSNIMVQPEYLPEFVDEQIAQQIAQVPLAA